MTNPNIIVFITEDLSPHAAVYGDKLSPLKSVDKLAEVGVVFENAFSVAPVCAPSRFSLITGTEPASCGPAHQMRADGILPEGFPVITTPLREAGYYCINIGKADYNFNANMKTMWDEHSMTADWSNRSDGQPFFAIYNVIETHESSIFSQKVTIVSPDEVTVPPYLPDLPEVREDMAKYYSAMNASEARITSILQRLEDEGLADNTAIIVVSDHGGSEPRSKRFVYDSGTRVPLVIRLPKSTQQVPERITTAVSLLDFAPTVCAIAGVEQPESMVGKSLLVTKKSDEDAIVFNGRDRMDENYDFIRTARSSRYLYIRNYMPNRPWLQHQAYAWQAPGYQAWERSFLAGETNAIQSQYFGPKPAEEFYDSKVDPHQIHNLIDSAEHRELIEKFRSALDARTIAINDNGFIPEGTGSEGYLNSHDPKLFSVEEAMALAKLAIARDSENIDYFITKLSDENETIRFWAAQGLLYLGKETESRGAEILVHLEDDSDHVRVALAELAAEIDHRDLTVSSFASIMIETKPFQVLMRATRAIAAVKQPLTELLPQVSALAAKLREPEFDTPGYFNAYTGIRYLETLLAGEYTPSSPIFDTKLFLDRLTKSSPDMVASMASARRQ